MTGAFFKKTIFISLLGHITIFSIFSFSFGNTMHKTDYGTVSFWGQVFHNAQVSQPVIASGRGHLVQFMRRPDTLTLDRAAVEFSPTPNNWQEKPAINLSFNQEKEVFVEHPKITLASSRRKEAAIIFHPLLPYSFVLYFKDRQVAHVELMFRIASPGLRGSIALKRKISSGNLEVDLLTMRYIGHYLFIQRPRLMSDNWQTVKIDLTATND